MIEVGSNGPITNTSKVPKMLDYLNNPHKYNVIPVGLTTIAMKMIADGFDPALFPRELQRTLSNKKKTLKTETVENKYQPQDESVVIGTPGVKNFFSTS